jgi:hypothetical protein
MRVVQTKVPILSILEVKWGRIILYFLFFNGLPDALYKRVWIASLVWSAVSFSEITADD